METSYQMLYTPARALVCARSSSQQCTTEMINRNGKSSSNSTYHQRIWKDPIFTFLFRSYVHVVSPLCYLHLTIPPSFIKQNISKKGPKVFSNGFLRLINSDGTVLGDTVHEILTFKPGRTEDKAYYLKNTGTLPPQSHSLLCVLLIGQECL